MLVETSFLLTLDWLNFWSTKTLLPVFSTDGWGSLNKPLITQFNNRWIFDWSLLSFVILEGVKELWLTSEDLGAYGRDLSRSEHPLATTPPQVASRWPDHLTLVDLLFALVPVIPAGCMLRLGMTNPPYILDQLAEVAAVLRHPRVYAFLHIPVQSGEIILFLLDFFTWLTRRLPSLTTVAIISIFRFQCRAELNAT